ncbi:TonB-dependent vitamin B12 receptor [Marichromatium gracile]|uniref:TonB-dependent vitamin B12 receptor n=1 Tax=Marichromatium gracile TaxID=1048 RepID=UPI001F1B572D|nr:TonB-dependent vitamin B12 receptor [Marichromatium gracile]MCF1181879.1 TonB-dependent vitamin B12 receptor [Marichromatium gracile]
MKSPLMLAALAAPLSAQVLAQTDSQVLEPTVVTATRTAEPAGETLATVSVIDRAEIERRQARSVPDLLRTLPGVSIAQSGGPGQSASVMLRGTNADHVLVLVDGVRVGSATLGTTSLQDLPVDQIERIEVVRGPRSSLYGSEAIGGVIQIFTRRGGGALTPRFSVGVGELGTASVSGGLSGGGEHAWFNLGANFEQTDGINACAGRPFPYAGCGVDQPDRDGYSSHGVSARAGYAFNERAEVEFHLLSAESANDFDGSVFSGNQARSSQQVFGANATLRPLDAWTLTLTAGRSWDDYRVFYDDAAAAVFDQFVDRFQTERDSLSLQSDVTIAAGQLVSLGVDYVDDRVSGTVDYAEDARDNLGVFGQYQGSFGAFDLKLSLRQDDNQQFGSHTTGSAALGYLFANDIQVALSYGTGFKAPTFNELYYPGFGNTALDPEESESIELMANGPLPLPGRMRGDWQLSLYQTEIDDLIAYDSATFAPANVDSARIRGLEASADVRWDDWTLAGNLTLLDPENRSDGANDGNLLPRRAEQSLQLDLDRTLGRWRAGATLQLVGERYDDLANQVDLDAYALLDLRLEYAFNPALRLQGRLANALDETYETAYLYNQPGRAFYLTLRYQP